MSNLTKAQQKFIDRLLHSFEKDIIPWRATWDRTVVKPYNASSNIPYKGINLLNLYMVSIQHGYDDPRWMTFKQANAEGYRIKKGSVGTDIFFYSFRDMQTGELIEQSNLAKMTEEEREHVRLVTKSYVVFNSVGTDIFFYSFRDMQTGELIEQSNLAKMTEEEREHVRLVTKSYVVFNANQIDGIPAIDVKKHSVEFKNDKAKEFISTLSKNANLNIHHAGNQPHYNPSTDMVVIPKVETFIDERAYYATLLHECGHATLHPSRLNRDAAASFGSEKYAKEELRAELTSAFLTMDMGFQLDSSHEENHQAYIQHWKEIIKTEPRFIFTAIKDAQKIREYLLEKGTYEKIYVQENEKENVKRNYINQEKSDIQDKIISKEIDLTVMKNSVSIVEYARDVLGMELVKESRGKFRLEEHHSCKIYPNNTFYRFSKGVGGSIIDFIKHFEKCDTKEAIQKISEYYHEYNPTAQYDIYSRSKHIQTSIEGIVVPSQSDTNKHVYAYLTKTRGIKSSVVNEFMNRKILYEDENRNCVFIGKLNKTIYYANIRGTGKKSFKQDVSGSVKEVGIYIHNKSETLVVNEAIIDTMSYMSLAPNPHQYNYLSVNGAANTVNAVRFHLLKREEAQDLKHIIIGLDNDLAGEEHAMKLVDFLKENYPNIETLIHIPDAKDFNEQLQNELHLLTEIAPKEELMEEKII